THPGTGIDARVLGDRGACQAECQRGSNADRVEGFHDVASLSKCDPQTNRKTCVGRDCSPERGIRQWVGRPRPRTAPAGQGTAKQLASGARSTGGRTPWKPCPLPPPCSAASTFPPP